MDIPKIKDNLENNSEWTEKTKTDMDNIAREIDSLGDQTESIARLEKNTGLLRKNFKWL